MLDTVELIFLHSRHHQLTLHRFTPTGVTIQTSYLPYSELIERNKRAQKAFVLLLLFILALNGGSYVYFLAPKACPTLSRSKQLARYVLVNPRDEL
jgi:hypothetical protein